MKRRCATLITEPSETRERLTSGLYLGAERSGASLVERAFHLVHQTEPIRHRLRQAKIKNHDTARASGLLTAADTAALQAADEAVHQAIMVDDFAPADLKPRRGRKDEKPSWPTPDNHLQAVRTI